MKTQLMLASLVLVSSLSANLHAQSRQAVALPIQMMGFFAERQSLANALNSQISSSLTSAGYDVVSTRASSRGNCHEAGCLESIRRSQRVDLVIATEIFSESIAAPAYTIRVWALGPDRGGLVHASEANCTDCNEKVLTDKLQELCAQVISGEEKSQLSTSTVSLVETANYSSKKRTGYLVLGSIGAVGFVGSSIALGLVLNAHHQLQCDSSFPVNRTCPFENNATVPAVIAGVSAAASIIVMGIGFGLAAKESKKRPLGVAPHLRSGGAMALVGGQF